VDAIYIFLSFYTSLAQLKQHYPLSYSSDDN